MAKTRPEASRLRPAAETALRALRDTTAVPSSAANQRMAYELDVYRTELEMQNDELRSTRNDLEAHYRHYAALFDYAPIGYAMLDARGKVCALNHAGAQLIGRNRARLLGTSFAACLATDSLEVLDHLLQCTLGNQTMERCELVLVRPDGSVRRMQATAALLTAEIPAVLLGFQDVTEQREREHQLINAEATLREMAQRKDEFLALLSHELRNPLAPIRNSLYVLDRVDPLSKDALQARATIDRQVAHLTRLVDDLLDVTRVARGKVQLRRERIELGDLVRSTMDDHRVSFQTSGVRLEGRFEPGHFWVSGDAARLVQVLSNLLGNAEKFTPRGGSVVVTLERRGVHVALTVRDNGAGIDSESLDYLFEPFAQAPQTLERTRGGLGLGLTLVKGLVELHRGAVRILSEGLDKGTECTVLLPMETGFEAARPVAEPAQVLPRRILVIDDNFDAADTLKTALQLCGHKARVAYDGESALEIARSGDFDVVICDIALPGMSGYLVARAFRADDELRDCYLIALTGCAQPEDIQRAMDAGFDHHIAKPMNFDDLNRILADVRPAQ